MIHPAFASERLLYRPVAETDIPFFDQALTDPGLMQYMSIRFTTHEPGREQWDWYQSQLVAGTALFYSVFTKETNSFCGVCSLYYYEAPNQKAELGYWFLPEFWGQGYASEACPVVIAAARRIWQLHRIEAIIETEHAASRRILEKCGFKFEGVLRELEQKADQWINLEVWGLVFEY